MPAPRQWCWNESSESSQVRMSTLAATGPTRQATREHPERVGPIGRLGRWTADHIRVVAIAWACIAVAFGVSAPKVESALSGAGWQANGSESVHARQLIQANFHGLSSSAPDRSSCTRRSRRCRLPVSGSRSQLSSRSCAATTRLPPCYRRGRGRRSPPTDTPPS